MSLPASTNSWHYFFRVWFEIQKNGHGLWKTVTKVKSNFKTWVFKMIFTIVSWHHQNVSGVSWHRDISGAPSSWVWCMRSMDSIISPIAIITFQKKILEWFIKFWNVFSESLFFQIFKIKHQNQPHVSIKYYISFHSQVIVYSFRPFPENHFGILISNNI